MRTRIGERERERERAREREREREREIYSVVTYISNPTKAERTYFIVSSEIQSKIESLLRYEWK